MVDKKKIFYLGVEGGATKSSAILTDERGIIRAKRVGKSSNYLVLGKTEAKKNLKGLLGPIIAKTSRGKICAVFGFAGLDTPSDAKVYETIIHPILPRFSVFRVVDDTKISLEVRCPDTTARIVAVSGTGSISRSSNSAI